MLTKNKIGNEVEVKPLSKEKCLSNADGKFSEQDIIEAFDTSLKKFLGKRKYTIGDSGGVVIEGDLVKVDIGHRFKRYISIGLAGKAYVSVDGRISKNDEVLETFTFDVPMTSASWLHTPRFLCRKAAEGCALKVAKIFEN